MFVVSDGTGSRSFILPIANNKQGMDRSLRIVTGFQLPALEEERFSIRLKQCAREALQVINRVIGEEFTAREWAFTLTLCVLFVSLCSTSPLFIAASLVATAVQLRSIRKGGAR